MAISKKKYTYNPHAHVKIWLSNKPQLFMNIENKMRLITMREQNPKDTIHLIYDSSLLHNNAQQELEQFCKEYTIVPLDADAFDDILSEKEKQVYFFYKDEINHLREGGNLGVASDILRWLSPVYTKGSYTDFDVPVNTATLPLLLSVDAPLLLNIGSFRLGKKEMLFSNNDFIAVVDPKASQRHIEAIQDGIIQILQRYNNDFIERTMADFCKDSMINPYLIKFMKNRTEAIYIMRSTINFTPQGSRQLRHYINQITSDSALFLNFHRQRSDESDAFIINRLRQELQQALTLTKKLFFKSEYHDMTRALSLTDNDFIAYLMKRERVLYLKSIVVCTAGPLALANFIFGKYVFDSQEFIQEVAPYSLNSYGLKRSFQSLNSLALRTRAWGMLNFLGTEDGTLNDSSWLETGEQLQKNRALELEGRRQLLLHSLPQELLQIKWGLEQRVEQLEWLAQSVWGQLFKQRYQAEASKLKELILCFQSTIFDVHAFKTLHQYHYKTAKSKKIMNSLNKVVHEASIFMVTQDKKINLSSLALEKYPIKLAHPKSHENPC